MLNYLYYKLYRAHQKGSLNDIAEWVAMISLGALIGANLLVLGTFLRKVHILPFFFSDKMQVIAFMVGLLIMIFFFFMHKKRYKGIIEKYKAESERQRKKGNLYVWLYIVLSFLLIFAVAFYKPGVL